MHPTLQSNRHNDDFGLLKANVNFVEISPYPLPSLLPLFLKPLRMEETNEEEDKFLACNSQ